MILAGVTIIKYRKAKINCIHAIIAEMNLTNDLDNR